MQNTVNPETTEISIDFIAGIIWTAQSSVWLKVESSELVTLTDISSPMTVNFNGTDLLDPDGVVTGIGFVDNGKLAYSFEGLSITKQTLQYAFNQILDGNVYEFRALFANIDWVLDLSASTKDNTLMGTGGQDNFKAGSGNDSLYIDGGNDVIDLGGGADSIYIKNFYGYSGGGTTTVTGGAGSDTFMLQYGTDEFDVQLVDNGMTVDLTKKLVVPNAYAIVMSQVENIEGSSFADKLLGSAVANKLFGNGGIDVLTGRAGADQLDGGAKNDTIIGGAGKDRMIGGAGADDFIFQKLADSRGVQRDVIVDFEAGIDDVDLRAIGTDARKDNFIWIGDAKFTGRAGDLHYRQVDNADSAKDFTYVEGDTNGDRKVDILIQLNGLVDPTKADFFL
ncbi:calcium-binding protein [Rhizobium alvei]|uniref:Calcium-binding protein n=1 Tax=Rhizobium alvei TaxID=1132659 RepID=A0ABT8YHL9_9HYPH|nr:calcium-binding protein [Rhizobium alvei]MDO6963180.1 calcium-binding protein [Rhizobium alvei]